MVNWLLEAQESNADCLRAPDWLFEAQEKHTCPAWSAERVPLLDWLLEAQESSAVFAWLAERVPSWLAARKHISQNPGYTAKPQTAGTKNIPGQNYEGALHQAKTFSHTICMMRIKQRFGEEAAYKQLRPGITYSGIDATRVFRLMPLPHGMHRGAVKNLLQQWNWPARPLQPGKGGPGAMSWTVGTSTAPPCSVLPGPNSDVLVSEITPPAKEQNKHTVLAFKRTQQHLRDGMPTTSTSTTTDPWQDPSKDPWGRPSTKPKAAAPASLAPCSSLQSHMKYDEIADNLRTELQGNLQKELQALQTAHPATSNQTNPETEQRLAALESSITEIKGQNAQFSQWFTQIGSQQTHLEQNLQAVQQQTQQNLVDMQQLNAGMHNVRSELGNRFDGLEAMLAKRLRIDEP